MNSNVEQASIFDVSELEMLSIENALTDVLNTVVKSFGMKMESEAEIEGYLWKIAEKKDFGFPNVEKAFMCRIISRVSERARECGFPQAEIPRKEVRVSMMDIVERAKVGANSILKAEKVLTVIGEYMEVCGDPRGDTFMECAALINEMIVQRVMDAKDKK